MTLAIVVAAGRGRRMGGEVPKQYLPLGSESVIGHTLRVLDACRLMDGMVWVAPEPDLDFCREQILDRLALTKPVWITAGGFRRQDSVYRGLRAAGDLLRSGSDLVAVHDGVRPLVTPHEIDACIRRARATGACILGMPVFDTLKRIDSGGHVVATTSREGMWTAQTPQVFRYDLILRAHEEARRQSFAATDDAQLVEHLGERVSIIRCGRHNLKITTAEDLALARFLVERPEG